MKRDDVAHRQRAKIGACPKRRGESFEAARGVSVGKKPARDVQQISFAPSRAEGCSTFEKPVEDGSPTLR